VGNEMKRFYAVDDERFEAYKTRANLTVNTNIECIDEDIRRVILELNQLDGVAPVWSCASHPETRKIADRKMHVICAVNEKGAGQLDKVYQEWTNILIEYGAFHMPCIGIVRLMTLESDNYHNPGADDLYYAVELKVDGITTKRFKRAMLLSLEEAIRNVSF
jgi:hypothetical protein